MEAIQMNLVKNRFDRLASILLFDGEAGYYGDGHRPPRQQPSTSTAKPVS